MFVWVRPKRSEKIMSKTKTKRYLVLLAAIGLVAAALGGTGTFASFSAETTNAGNFFATGTLFLHNNGGTTTCKSETSPTNIQTSGCDVLFSVAPLNDATNPNWAHLTLTNAGSVDAVDIKFDAPGATPCQTPVSTFSSAGLTAPLPVAGSQVTTLTFQSLTGSIAVGDPITVTEGSHGQTFTATQAVTTGATSVTVQSVNAGYSFTTAATLANATTFGGGGIDLCQGLQFIIVETGSNFNTNSPTAATSCSYGVPTAGPPYTGCVFDASKTLFNLPNASMQALKDSDGTTNTNLLAGQSRYFLIGIKPSVSLDNTYQNRRAQFNLHWKIDQA
jgi:hypothetical protein